MVKDVHTSYRKKVGTWFEAEKTSFLTPLSNITSFALIFLFSFSFNSLFLKDCGFHRMEGIVHFV